MNDKVIPLVVISGPIGVGKTSVGHEVSVLLTQLGIAHTFVDLDALTQTFPRPSDDRFGSRLANANLTDVWMNCIAAGSQNLIVARVVESPLDVENIERAVSCSRTIVCQLQASDESLVARVGGREIGSEYDWHEKRVVELARSLPLTAPADFIIDTESRALTDIANEIVSRINWQKRACSH